MRQYYIGIDHIICILFLIYVQLPSGYESSKSFEFSVDISDLDLILKGQTPRIHAHEP